MALALGVALPACTEAGVQPIPLPPLETSDDQLQVLGRFCTEPPEEVIFPVKVLFVVDQSASLQCTDSNNRRFQALGDLIAELRPNPHVSFGFIGFSSWSRELAFTRDRAAIDPFLDPAGGLGPATDYQGALATALRVLEQDMIDSGPAVRARTKYVIVFVSDGVAEPRCRAGCEDDLSACTDGLDNDGDGLNDASDPDCDGVGDNSLRPDTLYPVCNTTQEVGDDVYVDYDGICPAYNQQDQILRRVGQLSELADSYAAGDMTLHTVLLFAPQAVVEAVCPGASAAFGYNGALARGLLQAMAQQGGGTFRDVNLATNNARFFDFDFGSLESEQWLTTFIAHNMHARRAADGRIAPDSDADGLIDDVERELGTDPARAESDGGDNYSDLFEAAHLAAGFDPNDPNLPAAPCDDAGDLDGDRLTNCEETYLGTGLRTPDTDRDGMLDWFEVAQGTDPLTADAGRDLDFDGVLNGDELGGGTDPLVPDARTYRDDRIRYGLTDLGNLEVRRDGRTDTRHCYDFSVSRVTLTTPLLAASRGLNRVLLYTLERPVLLTGIDSRAHVACVDTIYEGPTDKVPADGLVDLRPEAWDALHDLVFRRGEEIKACDPASPGVDAYRRSHLRDLMASCLPPRVAIDGILHHRDDLTALLGALLDNRLRLRLPEDSSALFVPIESFDPDRDCYRPKSITLLQQLLDVVLTECSPCLPTADAPEDPP